jgi:hypothetical protein
MNLNTDHLKRCIETLRLSLTFYEKAATDSIDNDVSQLETILRQRFSEANN